MGQIDTSTSIVRKIKMPTLLTQTVVDKEQNTMSSFLVMFLNYKHAGGNFSRARPMYTLADKYQNTAVQKMPNEVGCNLETVSPLQPQSTDKMIFTL